MGRLVPRFWPVLGCVSLDEPILMSRVAYPLGKRSPALDGGVQLLEYEEGNDPLGALEARHV